jgi:hypothetical protein
MDGVQKRRARRGGRNQKRGRGSAPIGAPTASLAYVDVLPPTSATPTINLLISGLARPYSAASLVKFLTDAGVPLLSLENLWRDTLRTNALVTLPEVSMAETLQRVIDGREFAGRILQARFSTLDHIQAAANVSEAKAAAAAAAAAAEVEGDGEDEGGDSNADDDYSSNRGDVTKTANNIEDVTASKEHNRKLKILKIAADKCARSGRTVASEVVSMPSRGAQQRSDGAHTDQAPQSLLALDMRYHRTTAMPRLCWLPPEVSEQVAADKLALLVAERANFSVPQSYYSYAQPRAPAQTRPFVPSQEAEWGGSRAPHVANNRDGQQHKRSEYFYPPQLPPPSRNYDGDNRSFVPPPSYGRRGDDFGPPPRRDTERYIEYRNQREYPHRDPPPLAPPPPPPPPPLFGHHVPEFSRGEEGGSREESRGR